MAMMMVACGRPSSSASRTPVWPKPWSSLCRPVRIRSKFSFWIARRANGGGQRIELEEFVIGDVDAAIGALGQGFFDGLLGALGAHGDGDHFAAVLFLQAQGFFEGVGVGLVGFKADIGFADPGAAFGDGERRVLGGNLFDANADFQG
jgi:hypothetical protein